MYLRVRPVDDAMRDAVRTELLKDYSGRGSRDIARLVMQARREASAESLPPLVQRDVEFTSIEPSLPGKQSEQPLAHCRVLLGLATQEVLNILYLLAGLFRANDSGRRAGAQRTLISETSSAPTEPHQCERKGG